MWGQTCATFQLVERGLLDRLERRTVSLSQEQATYIELMVSSGEFASASAVVRAAIQELQEQYAFEDWWLCEEDPPFRAVHSVEPDRTNLLADNMNEPL